MFVWWIREQGTNHRDDELKQTICSQKPYGDWLNQYKIVWKNSKIQSWVLASGAMNIFWNIRKHSGIQQKILIPLSNQWRLMVKKPSAPWAQMYRWRYWVISRNISSLFQAIIRTGNQSAHWSHSWTHGDEPLTFVGNNGNLLDEDPTHCHSGIKTSGTWQVKNWKDQKYWYRYLSGKNITDPYFVPMENRMHWKRGLDRICRYAEDAVHDGFVRVDSLRSKLLTDRGDSYLCWLLLLFITILSVKDYVDKWESGRGGRCGSASFHFACLLAFSFQYQSIISH